MTKKRIWELDALRGGCIIAMILIHFIFDLNYFGRLSISLPSWFLFLRDYGHVVFIVISGICVTFASACVKRGIMVFGCGLLISYVTLFMDQILGFAYLRIWFGVLHMLGVCMMLYPLFRRVPALVQFVLGFSFIILGFWLSGVRIDVDYLFPLGLRSGKIFTGSDYFPIFPGLGWFLIGAGLGKTIYKNRTTRFPKINAEHSILRFFRFCGIHSLIIYLLHQPILAVLVMLIF